MLHISLKEIQFREVKVISLSNNDEEGERNLKGSYGITISKFNILSHFVNDFLKTFLNHKGD